MKKYVIMIVVLGIVAAVIGALANGILVPRSVVKNKVADTAKQYVQELGMEYVGGSGPGVDNDNDGYVSIDVNVKTKQGEEKRMNLECEWTLVPLIPTGCKEKVIVRTQ